MEQQIYNGQPTEKELSKMNSDIATLKERAKKSKIDARESFETQLRAIEDQYDLIVTHMNKASQQANAISKEFKDALSKAWSELKSSFDNVSKYLH